jgi:phospholipase/carboxylesterase
LPADFIHRYIPGARSSTTLLLLHGTGGDEEDLLPIGTAIAPGVGLLSPRGQVLENGMPRFFRRFQEGVFDENDIRVRAQELADFVESSAARYGFDPARVIALGYSNGANIAAANLLLTPGLLRAAVLLRAQLPLTPDPLPALPPTPVIILAGSQDPIVAPSSTEALAKLLSRCGAQVEVHWQNAGHELVPEDFATIKKYLTKLIF